MRKSTGVNKRLREAVRYDVRMLRDHTLGQKALDTSRAWLDRDYTNIPAGLCYQADDVTLPVLYYVPDGKGWFNLVRGQCLLVVDFRTWRILGFSLQPDRNYNSQVIFTLFARVFTDWGVPSILYLERGIWRDSQIITGGVKARRVPANWQELPFTWSECSRGFGDLGVRFIHAIRARSKNVERIAGLVQELMISEKGYTGREERHDKPAICKQHEDEVRHHRCQHPSQYFHSMEQWRDRLMEIFTRYNSTRQYGKILGGFTPDQAQEQFQDPARAPLDFDLCRHLLAHFKVPVTVGSMRTGRCNGITITFRGRAYVYRNEQTGRDKFQRKLAWFNPDEPSLLAVTDLNMRNPYSVPLSNSVDALAALEPEGSPVRVQYEEELARIAEHEQYSKTLYQTLKPRFQPVMRRVLPNRAVTEVGEHIDQERRDHNAAVKKTVTRKRNVERRADVLNIPAEGLSKDSEADAGTAMMLAAKRAHERKQNGNL